MSTQLSPHFSFEELTVSGEHPDLQGSNRLLALDEPYHGSLVALATMVLEPLREAWGAPLHVNSGFRSPELNKAIHGAATSQHLKGEAADLDSADNYSLWQLAQSLMEQGKIKFGQLILEKGRIRGGSEGWVHISSATSRFHGEVLTFDGMSYHLIRKIA